MPHIDFKNDLPGIRSAMTYTPETVAAIDGLEEILLRRNEGHAHAESELIERYVPCLNDCFYCYSSRTGIACIYLYVNRHLVKQIKKKIIPKPVCLIDLKCCFQLLQKCSIVVKQLLPEIQKM